MSWPKLTTSKTGVKIQSFYTSDFEVPRKLNDFSHSFVLILLSYLIVNSNSQVLSCDLT